MGSKSKVKKQKARPQESYQQAVALGVARALKGELQMYAQDIYDELGRNMKADFGSAFKMLGHRIQAAIDMLLASSGKTEADFNEKVLDIEDEVDGYMKSALPVKQGDRVRFVIKDTALEGEGQKIKLDNLLNGRPELHGDIEGSLIGMNAGETKTLNTTLGEGEKKKEFTFEITMDRVSNNLKPVESPKATEETPAEQSEAEKSESND